MIRRLGDAFTRFFRAFLPDPFVLALLLTVVVAALAAALADAGAAEILDAWRGPSGFFSMLPFTMQMVLMLVTGHSLAHAPAVQRGLARLAALPRSGAEAAAWVAFVAIGAGLLNWGLGLIVGAVFARAVGERAEQRGIRVHYPLLAAAGYTALMCWHGGLSGSAPLKMTQHKDVAELLGADLAARVGTIPLTRTTFAPANLVITGGLLLLVPLVAYLLAPRDGEGTEGVSQFVATTGAAPAPHEAHPAPADTREAETWAERLDRLRFTAWLAAAPLATAAWMLVAQQGVGGLDPNALNLAFLSVGLLLHGSLRAYGRAAGEAMRDATSIALQFPFYAGIMGVLRDTGLAAVLASAIGGVVTAASFPALTFLSAGVVNMFVPSGGGQWAVQGPIALETALRLDLPPEAAVMAVAYGDQITNMLQPFWALPLLAITGVRAKDIVGYSAVLMLFAAAWIATLLTLWPR